MHMFVHKCKIKTATGSRESRPICRSDLLSGRQAPTSLHLCVHLYKVALHVAEMLCTVRYSEDHRRVLRLCRPFHVQLSASYLSSRFPDLGSAHICLVCKCPRRAESFCCLFVLDLYGSGFFRKCVATHFLMVVVVAPIDKKPTVLLSRIGER